MRRATGSLRLLPFSSGQSYFFKCTIHLPRSLDSWWEIIPLSRNDFIIRCTCALDKPSISIMSFCFMSGFSSIRLMIFTSFSFKASFKASLDALNSSCMKILLIKYVFCYAEINKVLHKNSLYTAKDALTNCSNSIKIFEKKWVCYRTAMAQAGCSFLFLYSPYHINIDSHLLHV